MPNITQKPTANPTTPTQDAKGRNVCHAGVRFDRTRDQWGILDKNLKTVRTFERGLIVDAELTSKAVRIGTGCGATSDVIGAAYGEIREGTYGDAKVPKTGFKNLEFKDGVFINGEGERIETASYIRLMPGRKATYRP